MSETPVGATSVDDEELFWRAADELLTALAASPVAHHRLAAVRGAVVRNEALQSGLWSAVGGAGGADDGGAGDVGDDGDVGDAGGPDDDGAGSGQEQRPMTPEERAEANRFVEVLGDSGLPLVAEVLARLDEEAIRPELVGVSRAGLDSALDVMEGTYRRGEWRTLPEDELNTYMEALLSEATALARTQPLRPRRGETKRIVSVVRRMPKETVVRLVRVWNPLVLRVVVSLGLRAFRKMAAEDAAEKAAAEAAEQA